MNCQSARATATRWLNGDRSQPVTNMIIRASLHTDTCREAGCVQARMKLDHQQVERPKSFHAETTGAP